MEPFAQANHRRSRAPWVTAGIIGGLFVIWQLDVLPRIGAVATGRVDQSPADSAVAFPAEAWDAIVDRGGQRPRKPDSESAGDPLMTALAAEHEPLQVDLQEPASAERDTSSVTGPQRGPIRPASFEISDDRPADSAPAATVIPAELADRLREIDQLYRDDLILDAHAALSEIYWKEPAVRPLIRARIEHTASLIYTSADRLFEAPVQVQPGDTLSGIAERYQLTWQYLARLNRTAPERLQAGQQLKVLQGPFSAVVDLDDYALTIHAHGWFVQRYQIGIGKDHRTPVGEFVVEEKLENPVWYNPDGGQMEADDPANPLGEFWLGLGNHIGIHGTIDPESIGSARSRGCIHLADPDIEEVYHLLRVGSKVLIRR